MSFLNHILQLLEILGLVKNPGLDLMGPAPVGDSVEVVGQWGVAEELGFFVLGVFGEWEGVVGGDAAEEDESCVAEVSAEL